MDDLLLIDRDLSVYLKTLMAQRDAAIARGDLDLARRLQAMGVRAVRAGSAPGGRTDALVRDSRTAAGTLTAREVAAAEKRARKCARRLARAQDHE